MLVKFDMDPANVDPNGIADDLPTGTDWSLAADAEWLASDSGDSLAHRLIVTTAGNEPAGNGPTLTLTGTDADGRAQTEALVLPNATTIESTKYWLTVTSGSTGANATVGTFDIGWVDEFAGATVRLGWRNGHATLWDVDVTGTINVGVEFTLDDFDNDVEFTDQSAVDWTLSETGLTAETADILTNVTNSYVAARVVVVSYTNTAEVQIRAVQGE